MKYLSLIILLVALASCEDSYNAERAAERYCRCMRENNSPKNFENASQVCDGALMRGNRYVKLYITDMRSSELDKKLSDETRDSVNAFIAAFMRYANAHCCKETLECRDSSLIEK